MAQDNTQGTLSSMVPQGTPAAPPQTPPSFGAKLLGNKEFSVELNDAVFETEAWRGSRYNGHQLEAVEINKFNKGDKTYAKTPVVEKYSRNIYIGNRIIGFEDDPINDDPSPCFIKKSYTTVNGYFTINSDDTVTEVGTSFNTDAEQQGFERSFREDFAIGSKASIILLDKGIEQDLKKTYTVDYNEGLLSRILDVSGSLDESNPISVAAGNIESNLIGSVSSLSFIQIFFPGNLTLDTYQSFLFQNDSSKYYTDISGSGANFLLTSNAKSRFKNLMNKSQTHYFENPQSNKFFIELKTPNISGSVNPYGFNTNPFSLNSINVFEIDMNNFSVNTNDVSFTSKTNSQFSFIGKFSNPSANIFESSNSTGTTTIETHFSNTLTPPQAGNHFVLYKLNRTPSLLINMIKSEDLPNGIGENGFIIIPENLDPKIKYNLSNILKSQLGIEVETGYAINGDVSPFDRKN